MNDCMNEWIDGWLKAGIEKVKKKWILKFQFISSLVSNRKKQTEPPISCMVPLKNRLKFLNGSPLPPFIKVLEK